MADKTITVEIPVNSARLVIEALETVEQKTDMHQAMVRALREQIAAKLLDA